MTLYRPGSCQLHLERKKTESAESTGLFFFFLSLFSFYLSTPHSLNFVESLPPLFIFLIFKSLLFFHDI